MIDNPILYSNCKKYIELYDLKNLINSVENYDVELEDEILNLMRITIENIKVII